MTPKILPSNLYKDVVGNYLRAQISTLNRVLESVESQTYEADYVHETLKSVEVQIRRLRKFIDA